MAEPGSRNETREDVLHAPNLFEYFCMRTAEDMRSRGGDGETPATSFAGLLVAVLMAAAFYIFGKPQLAQAAFVLSGALLLWTIWGVVIRSSEQLSQKVNNIRAGVFPAAAAPFVLARLKWWNHLVVPQRWGRHSRLFDRRAKLERKVEEVQAKIAAILAKGGNNPPEYTPPSDAEAAELADVIRRFSDRNAYELEWGAKGDELDRMRGDLLLYMALMHKIAEMADRLDRIDKLSVVFHNVSADDLSQVVSEGIQVLEERRLLVLGVDMIDPEDFIDLVTVRS